MHRQSIEFLLASLVAAILSMIPNILAKDVGYSWWLIGALTCLFLLMYIIIPRLVWYVFSNNTIKILDTGVYIQFHNQGGNPNVAFFVMWPNFWSSSIYVRGAVYQIVSDNSRLILKDFG